MTRPAHLTINEQALRHNLQCVRACAPRARVIAMVKANAYGHGLKQIVRVLTNEVAMFGVACIEEALQIRQYRCDTPIILMEGTFEPSELSLVIKHHLAIVLHNQLQLERLLASQLSQKINVWIKLDTGMHRLGFQWHNVAAVYEKLHHCPWVMQPLNVMTHFACADEVDNPATALQLRRFEQALQGISYGNLSLANSAAIIAWPQTHADFVRPGIMLYGISPFSDKIGNDFGLQPVMGLHSQLIALTQCHTGDAVGYGGIWRCPKPGLIGVVAIGYGDGYPRHVRQHTPVLVNGQRVPLIGRVSMDMLTVDLATQPQARIGDTVELWGPNLSVEEIARCADTSPYELVCQISERVRQVS